ncbi:MAG: tRNA glutamyl-Q(34) synthetase GluQRS [Methylococcales bacterium]|nr:tRNA glutamyl-Q(34) synthetase GluQRS [Methylococcales bacterium]
MKNKWGDFSLTDSFIYRGRFAPSPTGQLHLGSLYTAVASFLDARAHQGQWLVRMDDLDTPRNYVGASDDILRTLDVFGLHWDESVFYQSQHAHRYQAVIKQLRQQQRIYPCICSRKNLADANSQGIYPQFCRDKVIAADKEVALRVKTTEQIIHFQDELQGLTTHNLSTDEGDFIIQRKDKIIAYQLAVVVDDNQQRVNHVLRGMDLLTSTPRQLYLQKLLSFPTPNYLHSPIIMDEKGQKLSKQTFAKAIDKHQPEKTLFYILELLKQQPPVTLKGASVNELLNWAIAHWQVKNLQQVHAIQLKK